MFFGRLISAPSERIKEIGNRSGTSSEMTVHSRIPDTPAKPNGSSATPTVVAVPPIPRAAAVLLSHLHANPWCRRALQRRRRLGLPISPSCPAVSTNASPSEVLTPQNCRHAFLFFLLTAKHLLQSDKGHRGGTTRSRARAPVERGSRARLAMGRRRRSRGRRRRSVRRALP